MNEHKSYRELVEERIAAMSDEERKAKEKWAETFFEMYPDWDADDAIGSLLDSYPIEPQEATV